MCKFNNATWNCFRVSIIITLLICLSQITVNAASTSSTCNSSSNCTLREWLTKLQEESYSLECTLSQLEKSTALLSKVNYSTTSMRMTQISKLKKTISNLKGEIEIINLTCSTFYGPDCNLTTPECDLKCVSCSSPGQCSVCYGNWNGPTCSTCKLGWNGTDCNTPICDSKCISCASPGQCICCSGNWNGTICSTCKTGWNGTLCNIPICDSKCSNCTSPGICSNCTGNWNGTTCSTCKTGWNGTDCITPICDSKCVSCAYPGVCSNCTSNWNGTTCSNCKSGWSGTLCNIPVCDSKCTSCASPGQCISCSGNWNGITCSTCKTGWYGPDCNSNFALILTSAQITKFTSTIMSNPQISYSKLLFKASRDGFSASAFHSKCDNKGPTIVIIKATSGAVFGGYTSTSWRSQGNYVPDTSAFIFSLISPSNTERFKILSYQYGYYYKQAGNTNNQYAINNDAGYGPIFGGGSDINIADNCNSNTNSYSNLCQSYCDTTMTSDTATAQAYLAGTRNFQVEDYEVYSL